jgi:hypothetical protein
VISTFSAKSICVSMKKNSVLKNFNGLPYINFYLDIVT